MIRAIITDVDGVIVGRTPGVNFPLPNEAVLSAFEKLHKDGLPIVLCTAKSLHAIVPIIEKAKLTNPHIADGGALLMDPLDKKITAKHVLAKEAREKVVAYGLEHNLYMEVHRAGAYYVLKSQEGEFTKMHAKIMQQEPILVQDLTDIIKTEEIIKFVFITKDKEVMDMHKLFFESIHEEATVVITMHPSMGPVRFAVLTAPGVSKKHGAEEIVKQLGISFDEVLGIGDTLGDWKFMQLCGYVAVVGDESVELKEKAREKGEGKYFLAPDVEENGILQALDYFLR